MEKQSVRRYRWSTTAIGVIILANRRFVKYVVRRNATPKHSAWLKRRPDLDAIEQARIYRGLYFVLMGHLSPLDDIGPDQLGINQLLKLIADNAIEEVILATNLTLEGQATGDFLLDLLQGKSVQITQLARGMPIGGELEYMDSGTLNQAFSDRRSAR